MIILVYLNSLTEFSNRGTFFFDEIGDMSMPLQSKLLRIVEDQKIRRIGGQCTRVAKHDKPGFLFVFQPDYTACGFTTSF